MQRKLNLDEIFSTTVLFRMGGDRNSKRAELWAQILQKERDLRLQISKSTNFEGDFLKMFKMQMDLKQEDFEKLDFAFKLRFLCFFYFNFVDRIRALIHFKDAFPSVKMYSSFKQIKKK